MTNTNTLPNWMREMLIAKGALTETGLSRKAKILTHRPCGIPCLAGLDAPNCALETWCDLTELSTTGEAQALLQGRRTLQLRTDGTLNYRDHWNIKSTPAGNRHRIFATHSCNNPAPDTWATTHTHATYKPQATTKEGFPF